MLRLALVWLFALHGVAHLVGFVVPWKLATPERASYRTTVLSGTVDLGDAGIRVIGVFWLLAALGFWVVAVGVAAACDWWTPAAIVIALASLVLCIAGWPDARIGVPVNVAILAAVLVGQARGAL